MNFAKKSLGQNYLIDKNIIRKIINLVKIENRNIIEIGPGKGALTDEIIKRKPGSLIIIEKDNDLYKYLIKKYNKIKNIKIYNNDILNFNLEKIVKKNSSIFGNLPYNVSSQILVKIIKFKKWPPNYNDIIFMFQKELGNKIVGKFLSTDYSRISILSNYRLEVLKKFNVSSNCFFPRPKVTSLVLHARPRKKNLYKIKNINSIEKITRVLFSNKRKMINKNISKLLNKSEISKIDGINLKCTPSEIKPEIYYKIDQLFQGK